MVPRDLLRFDFHGEEVVPRYLCERDHGWLRALVDEYERYGDRPRRELCDRLKDPLPVQAPPDKLRLACHVLDDLWRSRTREGVDPKRARAVLFAEAAGSSDRRGAIERACVKLEVDPEILTLGLFADLPGEKLVTAPDALPSAGELAQRTNQALVAGMLRRAVAVSIEADSGLRAVVRTAKLKGLLCTVHQSGRSRRERLEISGPFALFRRTLMYGRALASLVGVAARCTDMELRAACMLEQSGTSRALIVRSTDPLFPGGEPKRYDSKLEERFAKDMARAAPDWDVTREPEAVPVEGTLVFPDFELRHRRDPERRWLLEIAGFWTPQYLEDKLRRLRAADLPRFILCVDQDRNCSHDELPRTARVVPYRRRVDVQAVLRIIDPGAAGITI